jgi:iron complex outermembrane receptor protein
MLSLGVFRKDIGTFIQGVSERAVFSSLGLPDSVLLGGGGSITGGGSPACPTLPDTIVVVNRKVNTPGGPLTGFEANLQAPFSFLPGAWSNFGAFNYTHVNSKITYITRVDNPDTAANELLTQQANFTGLSPNAHNITLYYEDPEIQRARVGGPSFVLPAGRAGRRCRA